METNQHSETLLSSRPIYITAIFHLWLLFDACKIKEMLFSPFGALLGHHPLTHPPTHSLWLNPLCCIVFCILDQVHVVLTCVASSDTLFYHNSDNFGTLQARQFFLNVIHTFEYICLHSARIAFLCAVKRPFSGSFHRFIQPFIMADLLFYINVSCCCRTAFIPLDQQQTHCRYALPFPRFIRGVVRSAIINMDHSFREIGGWNWIEQPFLVFRTGNCSSVE